MSGAITYTADDEGVLTALDVGTTIRTVTDRAIGLERATAARRAASPMWTLHGTQRAR